MSNPQQPPPNLVYIIRHGEKLGNRSDDNSGGLDLSIRARRALPHCPPCS